MSYSQKYCLVSLIDTIEVNTEFEMSNWPLHITMADVFAVDLTSDVIDQLSQMLANVNPVSITAGKDSTLGDTKVVLVEKNDKLQNLHKNLIDMLEKSGAVFNNPEFTRKGFLPHSTIQEAGRLNNGDSISIDTISLVDMFPGGNWQQRKVLQNFKLMKD